MSDTYLVDGKRGHLGLCLDRLKVEKNWCGEEDWYQKVLDVSKELSKNPSLDVNVPARVRALALSIFCRRRPLIMLHFAEWHLEHSKERWSKSGYVETFGAPF